MNLMDAKGRVQASEDDALGAEVPFTLSVRPALRAGLRKEKMKVSVVFRRTEVLDGAREGEFFCEALSEPSRFLVKCSSLNEIAAEKFLGWAGRRLPKHFADLAMIGRDHSEAVNKRRVAELIRLKFLRERSNTFFWRQNLKSARDLRRSFANRYEMDKMGKRWEQTMGGEVFLTRQEALRVDSITTSR